MGGTCLMATRSIGFRSWTIRLISLVAAAMTLASFSALAYGDDAETLFWRGRYDESAGAFPSGGLSPAKLAYWLARIELARGNFSGAKKHLRGVDQSSVDVLALWAEIAFRQGDYATAQAKVDAAVKEFDGHLAARWWQAEIDRLQGRLAKAEEGYGWFIDHYNNTEVSDPDDLLYVGLAAAQHARWKRNKNQFRFLVNRHYPGILENRNNYWPAHWQMAELFLEKFNGPAARREIDAGLAINPQAAELFVVRARLWLRQHDLARAKVDANQALRLNPSLLAAYQVKSDVLVADQRYQEAVSVLDAAVEIHPHAEETMGRLAGVYGLLDGASAQTTSARMRRLMNQAVDRNPHCGEFYRAMGETFNHARRYPLAAKYLAESIARLPRQLGVRGLLGLVQMRLGDESSARRLLDASFRDDPFNVRVRNQLEVLDVLNTYAVLETPHFVIKYDRGLDQLLAECAAEFLEEEVYPDIVKQLGFEPPEKSLFEIFNRSRNTSGHGWFSARMVGLPFIGTVGACAGKVVAMVSPTAMDEPFNWADVLRHEFVHVVNLQQTEFRIPHWYTEALAVWHEDKPRPDKWGQVLAHRHRVGKLFDLETIDQGFGRPKSGEDWTLAYCQAELYAEYMVLKFGPESLGRMLQAYTDNLSTAAAIERCFGVDQQTFEQDYLDYVDRVVAQETPTRPVEVELDITELKNAAEREDAQPADWANYALALLKDGDKSGAKSWATKAINVVVDQPVAGYVLARLELSGGNSETAVKILEKCLDPRRPDRRVLSMLARFYERKADLKKASELYQLGVAAFPREQRWLRSLAAIQLKNDERGQLMLTLQQLAQIDPDSRTIRKKLAQLALAEEDFESAIVWGQQATYIDCQDGMAHLLVANARHGAGQHRLAVRSALRAVRLEPNKTEWRWRLVELAKVAQDHELAGEHLQKIIDREPGNSRAKQELDRLSTE